MGRALQRLAFIALALLLAQSVSAAADDSSLAPPADESARTWSWFGDAMLREDHVNGIPRADDSVQRTFGRARVGVLFDPIPALEFGGAVKLAASSDNNTDDRINNFDERSNDVALDQLFVRWRPNDTTSFLLGKTNFPLELSPLTWDQDLRPVGISGQTSFAVGEIDRIVLSGGYFNGNLPYDDDSRIGAVQVAYRWHEGAPTSASVLLSYLDFSSLEQLTSQGLARTNRRVGNELVSDYHLFDLQFVGRLHPGDWPLEARLDLLRNVGADDERDGARLSVVLGDRRQPHGWEFGFAAQRIQRDAAMAAFNSDDWWFHSWSHGVMPWVGYGFDATWSMRLAGFHEKRDGVSQHTDRLLLDLYAQW
jgi:hypothetical protein